MVDRKEIAPKEKSKLLLSKSNSIHSSQVKIPNILKSIWPFILISFLNMSILTINLIIVSFLPDGINMVIAVGLVTPFLALFIHSTVINGISLGSITKKNDSSKNNETTSGSNNTLDFRKIKSSLLAAVLYSAIMIALYIGSSYGYVNFELPANTPVNNNLFGLGNSQAEGFNYIFITAPIIIFYAIKSWALKILISYHKFKIVFSAIAFQIILSIGLSVILSSTTPLGVLGAGLGLLLGEVFISLFVFWYLLSIIGVRFFLIRTRYVNIFKVVLGTWKSTITFILLSLVKCVSLVVIGIFFTGNNVLRELVNHQILVSIIIAFNFINLSLFVPRGIGHGLGYIFVNKSMCLNDFFRHKKELMRSIFKLWWASFIITILLFALYPAFTYCITLDSNSFTSTIASIGTVLNIPYTGNNQSEILGVFINNININLIPVYFMFVSFIVGVNTGLLYGPISSLIFGKNIFFYWVLIGFGITFILIFTFGLTLFGYMAIGYRGHSIFPLMIPFGINGVYIIIMSTFLWKKSLNKLINNHKNGCIPVCDKCILFDKTNKNIDNLSNFLHIKDKNKKRNIQFK